MIPIPLKRKPCPFCSEPISEAADFPKTTTITWHRVGKEPRNLPKDGEHVMLLNGSEYLDVRTLKGRWCEYGGDYYYDIESTDIWGRVTLPEVSDD